VSNVRGRRWFRPVTAAVVVSAAVFGPVPGAAAAGDPSAALDMEYVRQVVQDLTAIGSTDLGMRVFGTPEDLMSADYVAGQMRSVGLQQVALEQVPGDAWSFEGASVALSGDLTKTYVAGSMGGVPGTPPGGLSGRLVFVGLGTARDYAKLHVNATGKIVLAWWNPDVVWANHVAYEAQAKGAKALILATPKGGSYYQADGAIGSFDATCDPALCVPFVTISTRAAGRIVRSLLGGATIDATVTLDAAIRPGNGYNTYGVIPGSDPSRVIVVGAHHDAWWRGAMDDTSGVAMMLAVAKAMVATGYRPNATWVFTSHTGEEFGLADAYYDWLTGAWWQITHAHRKWQDSAVAFVNLEGHLGSGRLNVNVARELVSFVNARLRDSGALLADGFHLSDVGSWDEGWTFAAAGVPSITFDQFSPAFGRNLYHTQLDTIDRIDFAGLAPVLQAETQLVLALDARVPTPYGFAFRLRGLRDSVDVAVIRSWGFRPGPIGTALAKMADAWAAASAARAGADAVCFDGHLRMAARISLQGFTALGAWDDTIYPHQQVENDVWYLAKAVVSLRHGDWQTALRSLKNVANVYYVPLLARTYFQEEMSHHDPTDPNIAWGGQGHLAPYLDLWDVFMSIRKEGRSGGTDFAEQTRELRRTRDAETRLYGSRLVELTGTIRGVTAELTAAAGC
jgi:hypothetical protein